jgi:hypothetical protein
LILAGLEASARLPAGPGGIGPAIPSWLLYLVVPFTPLLLEAAGAYRQSAASASREIRVAAILVIVGVAATFLPLCLEASHGLSPRPAVGLGFAFILILARDAFVAHFRDLRERRNIP